MFWGLVGMQTDQLSGEAMAASSSMTKDVTGKRIYLPKHTFQVKKINVILAI